SAHTLTGAPFDLHVAAGRWIVLCFLGSPAEPRAHHELSKLLTEAHRFDEDRLVFYGVVTALPAGVAPFVDSSPRALSVLSDYGGAISGTYGAVAMPRTIILDPMLRAVADVPWDEPAGHAETVRAVLQSLPTVDESAGTPMSAPVLIVPRVFDFPLGDFLVQFYQEVGGQESGFMLDV